MNNNEKIERLQGCLLLIRRSLGWSATEMGNRIGVVRQTINNLEGNTEKYRMSKTQYLAIRMVLDEEIKNAPEKTTLLRAILEMLVDHPENFDDEKKETIRTDAEILKEFMFTKKENINNVEMEIARDRKENNNNSKNAGKDSVADATAALLDEELLRTHKEYETTDGEKKIKELETKISQMKEEAEKDQKIMIDAVSMMQEADGEYTAAAIGTLLMRLLERKKTEEINEIVKKLVCNERIRTAMPCGNKGGDNNKAEEKYVSGYEVMTAVYKAIGSGCSTVNEIYAMLEEENIPKYKINRMLSTLVVERLIEKIYVQGVIGKYTISVYKLADGTEDCYRKTVGENPVESECVELRREYGNYEHGYSVKECASLLAETGLFESVKIGEEREYNASRGNVPDIECKTPEGTRKYYTYVNGKLSEADYMNLFSSITAIAGDVNIIVPDQVTMIKIRPILKKWIQEERKAVGQYYEGEHYQARIISVATIDLASRGEIPNDQWCLYEERIK